MRASALGQEGTYNETQMEPVDYTCRLRYFERVGDKYAVKKQLKDLNQFDSTISRRNSCRVATTSSSAAT